MKRNNRNAKLLLKQENEKYEYGQNIGRHMAYIMPMILKDKFGFSMKKICNWGSCVVGLRQRWQDDTDTEITTTALLAYCEKKKVDAVGWVNSIPYSHKMLLADIKARTIPLGTNKTLDYSLLSTILIAVPILKENYRFSNAKIEEFLFWVKDFIDSYNRKSPKSHTPYLTDEDIWQTFIDEEHYDIRTGEKVG